MSMVTSLFTMLFSHLNTPIPMAGSWYISQVFFNTMLLSDIVMYDLQVTKRNYVKKQFNTAKYDPSHSARRLWTLWANIKILIRRRHAKYVASTSHLSLTYELRSTDAGT